MSKRPRSVVRCLTCGHEEVRWVGQCQACGAWGSFAEAAPATTPRQLGSRPSATPMAEVPLDLVRRLRTGIGELDRVLGGGFVPGGVVLLGGAPGVGKSTLILQAAQAVAAAGAGVLYVSAEESPGQVRLRAERLGALASALAVAAVDDLASVVALAEASRPALLVVDSIQTVSDPELGSSAGSVVQVRECAAALTRSAKALGIATVLIGHVTKEGALAGPRVLEHLVDAVLACEGDRHHALRLVRASKNRFGAAGEVGCFEMTGAGLAELADPSRLFLAEHDGEPSGVAVTIAVEGPRPLAVEVQALAGPKGVHTPRRQASGLDPTRLALLVAVLERRAGFELHNRDLYASAVGGVRLREPAVDLALCLALASAADDVPLPRRLLAIGEVGLAGEIRAVPRLEQRLREGARLGFRAAVVPASYDGPDHGVRLIPARDLRGALKVAHRPGPIAVLAGGA